MATKKHDAPAEPETTPSTSTDIAVAEKPGALATAFDFAADAQQFENNFTQNDLATPFLQILQSNSPQVNEGGPQYIEGAKAGMIYNTITKEVYAAVSAPGKPAKQPIYLVVADYTKTVIEWKTRESGGGFVANLGLAKGLAEIARSHKNEKKQNIKHGTDDHQLVETAQYFVCYAPKLDGDVFAAMAALTSTQLKKSRNLNSQLEGLKVEKNGKKFKPPSFYQVFEVTTVYESNDQGNWYGWNFTPYKNVEELGDFGMEIYATARKLREAISAGQTTADASYAASGSEGAAATSDENVPF